MPVTTRVNHSRHASIYAHVSQLAIGEVVSFRIPLNEWKSVSGHIRNRANSGAYGEGVTIKTHSRSVVNGHGKESKILYVEKVMK